MQYFTKHSHKLWMLLPWLQEQYLPSKMSCFHSSENFTTWPKHSVTPDKLEIKQKIIQKIKVLVKITTHYSFSAATLDGRVSKCLTVTLVFRFLLAVVRNLSKIITISICYEQRQNGPFVLDTVQHVETGDFHGIISWTLECNFTGLRLLSVMAIQQLKYTDLKLQTSPTKT